MRLIKSMITFHGDYFPLSGLWAGQVTRLRVFRVWSEHWNDSVMWVCGIIEHLLSMTSGTCNVSCCDITWRNVTHLTQTSAYSLHGNQYTLTTHRHTTEWRHSHLASSLFHWCGSKRIKWTLGPVVCVVITLCPWFTRLPGPIHPLCHKTENYPQSEPASNYVPWGE